MNRRSRSTATSVTSRAVKRSSLLSRPRRSCAMNLTKSRCGGFGIRWRQLPSESSSEPNPLYGGIMRGGRGGLSSATRSDGVKSAASNPLHYVTLCCINVCGCAARREPQSRMGVVFASPSGVQHALRLYLA